MVGMRFSASPTHGFLKIKIKIKTSIFGAITKFLKLIVFGQFFCRRLLKPQ
jgi:hypothetical protein